MSQRRVPPRLSPGYLENAALHYLERFASSRANLKRVLMRKADRALAHHGGDRAEAQALVEAAMARMAALGYLDDNAYAEAKVRAMRRRGGSVRLIRAALAAKGIEAERTEAALDADESDEHAAALALARRRRLGPFRPSDARSAHRDKDMAALGRAGFSWEIAKAVVEGDGES